jgi:hypothetical protein
MHDTKWIGGTDSMVVAARTPDAILKGVWSMSMGRFFVVGN